MPKRLISNWVRGFKPRVRPDFSRGFYVSGYKLIKVLFTRPNIANNAQKQEKTRTFSYVSRQSMMPLNVTTRTGF